MRNCEIHGARDLRIADRPAEPLAAHQVRVGVKAVGICGSDLHYYQHGRVGDFVIRAPLTPGHEASGQVLELGAQVQGLQPGQRVALNPSRSCGVCRFCRAGAANHCENVHFFGSASKWPHMQGAMREQVVLDAAQCIAVPDALSYEVAAFGEPLAVALHAVRQAGSLLGKSVMVVGAGPIGALVLMAARLAGASALIAADIVDQPLAVCARVGATMSINLSRDAAALQALTQGRGQVDVCFEVSGSHAALANCIRATRPCGTVVQVGSLGGSSEGCPFNQIMVKSLHYIGSFRFVDEYAWAVDYLSRGLLDVAPLLTQALPVERVHEAFALAADRHQAMKVMVTF
ncbi:L-idonate 5-dehydrogenase [Verminephrobacter eiseniae]|uniref:Alcohol dehydrogenase GroES domain protein n=1 Tax=Verminephrobacter eiseniae (strain EF01-2) TaxID=391735 RepID=A1WNS6_VEREI|nr:L-idonate 5-dehydrogenase [Verminephrobacter eiseniae]ABM59283.1 Alcohol dehydrogenase GroES domain protein [Verminephrobacter eiseniae EF01-2]MCW5284816.1 L-idonate 5-dehydrogenase [Verminephrobacter eiseniae]MCW5302522.1 L-idonate 5-dehydrogenase [Verminephrobacter eiseniae]MCW8178346.1 L-idonate 5-dehydrogenase [Verminephrobacter eiseniae]MCW8189083.1 L-idonate 5-dehydrogenase [Verminephrobacter eiseniae]